MKGAKVVCCKEGSAEYAALMDDCRAFNRSLEGHIIMRVVTDRDGVELKSLVLSNGWEIFVSCETAGMMLNHTRDIQ